MDFDTIWILCMMQWVLDRYDIIMGGVVHEGGKESWAPILAPIHSPGPLQRMRLSFNAHSWWIYAYVVL